MLALLSFGPPFRPQLFVSLQRATKSSTQLAHYEPRSHRETFLFYSRFLCVSVVQSKFSLAVGNPDDLYLGCVLQKPSAFALFHIEPVDRAAFVGEDLLQIPGRKRFCRGRVGFVSETPDGVDIIVLRKCL